MLDFISVHLVCAFYRLAEIYFQGMFGILFYGSDGRVCVLLVIRRYKIRSFCFPIGKCDSQSFFLMVHHIRPCPRRYHKGFLERLVQPLHFQDCAPCVKHFHYAAGFPDKGPHAV